MESFVSSHFVLSRGPLRDADFCLRDVDFLVKSSIMISFLIIVQESLFSFLFLKN